MSKIEKVLVPTDFSPGAEPALRRGIDLARQFGAELHLLHVALIADTSPMYPLFYVASDVEPLYAKVHEEALERLEELKGEVELPNKVQAAVRHANVIAPVVNRYAREEDIDLIAMGTHGWRGVRRFLLGSVAEEVVREAPCPVITFRADEASPVDRPERILAAIDFSEFSTEVVAQARELGALYHGKVDFVHVVPRAEFPHFYEAGHLEAFLAKFPEIEGSVLKELEQLVRATGGGDCDMEYHVLHGTPSGELLRWADDHGVDLFVIAARGLTEVLPVRLGSTAERIVRQARCAVFTVRPRERDHGVTAIAVHEGAKELVKTRE